MSTIIVTGHKNPDTDSVCSAYCYASLKNTIDGKNNYLPARCGHLNRQTKYIFDRLEITPPEFVRDIYPRVIDAMTQSVISVHENEPVFKVLQYIEEMRIRLVPVISDNNIFRGIVSLYELTVTELLGSEDITKKPEYLIRPENFPGVVPGKFLARGSSEEFRAEIIIGAMHFERSIELMKQLKPEKSILVVGNRTGIIQFAIEKQFPAIIITGVTHKKEIEADFSNYQGWVYLSQVDTADTHRRLNLSIPVKSIMTTDLPLVTKNDYLDYAREMLMQVDYRGLPVLDGEKLVGIITRSDIIQRKSRKLILTDHNEMSQAIDGAESAEIVEIIDHHRLGTIRTRTPIYVYAKPVGSTCTLVYQLYRFNEQNIPPSIAGLLMSGILSDTAILKSPTTTGEDVAAIRELSEIAGIDYQQLGYDMFASTDSLKTMDPQKVVSSDFKEYAEFGIKVGIGQVEVVTLSDLDEVREGLFHALEEIRRDRQLDWTMLMVTNILKEDSILLTTHMPKAEKKLSYTRIEKNIFDLPGVLSRKKQLLPEILRVLEEMNRERA
ncbi:MAG: putative manganese-dependent inorganic diphosphatase [Spirochaetota bacterium]